MWKAIELSAFYGDEPLFSGATFAVAAGDRVGLVGPNGAGKSTLLRIVAGELRPATGHVEVAPGGRIGYFAQQVPDPAATVGRFLDDAPGELPALDRRLRALQALLASASDHIEPARIEELGAVQERYAQLGGWAYAARVAEIRDRLGVRSLPDTARLGSLSGGEQARLMLACALIGEPTDLLLDEPTNHLDAEGIEWLGGYLARFTGSIVVVTHDRALLDRVATEIVEIDGIGGPDGDGRPQFYDGGYTAYRAEKQRRWERRLLDFEAQEKARARLVDDIEATKAHARSTELTTRNDRLRRYAKKVAAKAKARERRLARQMQAATWIAEPQTRPPLVLAFRSPRTDPASADGPATTVLAASDITIAAGTRTLARNVDLRVRADERIVLTGPNGSGKTTLLTTLAGIVEPASGHVTRHGVVALLPQTHDELRLRVSVLDFFRSRVPMYVDEAEELLRAYLFDDEQQRQPLRTLSAGEVRRLLLATIVNSDADAILLDEPTNFLDFDALDVVEEALRAYDGALLVVTHDAYLPKSIGCDRHLVLNGGRLVDIAVEPVGQ
jgi:ATPase subunit of ABC transporter with duplicated ATPase domains